MLILIFVALEWHAPCPSPSPSLSAAQSPSHSLPIAHWTATQSGDAMHDRWPHLTCARSVVRRIDDRTCGRTHAGPSARRSRGWCCAVRMILRLIPRQERKRLGWHDRSILNPHPLLARGFVSAYAPSLAAGPAPGPKPPPPPDRGQHHLPSTAVGSLLSIAVGNRPPYGLVTPSQYIWPSTRIP